MDNIMEQVIRDLNELADEHAGAASNEHIWALGSEGESAVQHEQYAEEHQILATLYRTLAMKAMCLV